MFPDLDSDAFHAAMHAEDRALAAHAQQMAEAERVASDHNAVSIARQVLSADDRTLKWSEVGSGVTDDLSNALEKLYARIVTRITTVSPAGRTTTSGGRCAKSWLSWVLSFRLEETVVPSATDEIAFKHAWKNGKWHAYEPVSLDPADADDILKTRHGAGAATLPLWRMAHGKT